MHWGCAGQCGGRLFCARGPVATYSSAAWLGSGSSVAGCSTPLRVLGLPPTDALNGRGPQRRPQKPVDRRLEEAAKAVGGGYCRLQMPLRPALGVSGTVAGHRLGALEEGGGGGNLPLWTL